MRVHRPRPGGGLQSPTENLKTCPERAKRVEWIESVLGSRSSTDGTEVSQFPYATRTLAVGTIKRPSPAPKPVVKVALNSSGAGIAAPTWVLHICWPLALRPQSVPELLRM